MMSARARFAIVSAATVFTMAVTASLGFWQLDRARQKLALQDQIDQRADLPAWQTGDLLQAADPREGLHRPVRLRGQWVNEATVFLDNRQMATRNGFFLITPLRLTGSQRAVLVQRGWVPRDFTDRSRVPAIDTPSGEVQVEGRLAPPPGKLFQLGEAGTGAIRQNIDLGAFARETGLDLLAVSVQQTGASPEELLREWPRAAVGVDKHHGYAFQWFGLCALAGLLYVWFQFISPRRKRISHGTDAR
ncbi:SURF1 family protein [Hydrogenophaga sp. PBL-H3]|uniref:SURF1 family protein n=1 Tax=Hydrogenophaga sp. PBL-H3 TaxID=434010 RepID=UPI0013200A55|nr:SURF1 family protein [Hydrogenophaga sp. PBL-H3]QHE75318.1 SURF1 family protein [Hydrogenophaga sp. PBL-H3]QHE79745.1 SURF1 family protein [Hydrogenophaga sp. PBL-H3]